MRNSPPLAQLEQVRPPRGVGAPSRIRSHYDRILVLLRERGPAGVLSSELYDAPYLFGRSPRNRISEIRKAGHLVKTESVRASVVRYVLMKDVPTPLPSRPQARNPEPPKTLFDLTRDAL